MAIETRLEASGGISPLSRRRSGNVSTTSPKRWWKGSVLVLAGFTVLATGATLATRALSSPETAAQLTHTVSRGDLLVTVIEEGILESEENVEIKCRVRGRNTVISVVESGTFVKPGDVLVELDTLFMEEQVNERTLYANWSRSSAERSEANVSRSELAVSQYEQGRYVSELMTLEKDLAIAEATLRNTKDIHTHAQKMAESGYVSELDVQQKQFAAIRADLDVQLKKTEIDVLKQFTRKEQLETLRGNLVAAKASHEANAERAMADASRRDRALLELEYCVVKAEQAGLVIHPSSARWENAPEIFEGASVHKDQVLLLMPDLNRMQVKVGIHESVIDRVQNGQQARVTLPDKTIQGTVSSVASVTRPAGWWTANEVKYDALIRLPPIEGLRPGMSAEVEVIIAQYENVLTLPVAAIVESGKNAVCWVQIAEAAQRRPIKLGDSNDIFTIVEQGLREGDEVILNPLGLTEARQFIQQKSTTQGEQATRNQTPNAENRSSKHKTPASQFK